MGCACIVKKVEIKIKEVDLSGDQTRSIQNESTTNLKTFSKQTTVDIFEIKKCQLNNSGMPKKKLDKANSRSIESNYSNSQTFSGPIITLLKNRVDNYQRKLKSKKVLN